MSIVIPPVDYSTNVAKYAWELRPFVEQDRNPPVQNTTYDLIDEEDGVMVLSVYAQQTNTETNGKDVDWVFTIDGEVFTHPGGLDPMVHATEYLIPLYATGDAVKPMVKTGAAALGFLMEKTSVAHFILPGTDVKIQYKMTSAAGTNQRIYAKCLYATLEAV